MNKNKSEKAGPVREAREPQETKKGEEAAQKAQETPDYKKKAEEAAREAKENYDRWLYLRADLENFKKRHYKERADLIKYGHEHFARELLEGVDSLESALLHAQKKDQDVSALGEGIVLTLKQFLKVFRQFGITPMDSVGKKFDPTYHKAVAEQEHPDQETGIILQEHKKGYMLHDRLLRAAHVIVATKKEKKKDGKE